ncbi:MAG TPA: DUF6158 family protein [Micromonosporaceae bacterium]|nr:DUF6158 family protein [Micromonosporaceae bacterium]
MTSGADQAAGWPGAGGAEPLGVPPAELSDENLLREVESLHRTRTDALRHGPEPALAQHDRRTAELEAEYLRRFPDREVTRGAGAGEAESPRGYAGIDG